MNRYAAALSVQVDLEKAIQECVEQSLASFGEETPDLAVIFVSHEHHAGFDGLPAKIRELTGARHLVGCAGETVVGNSREVEAGPALSLWLARFPEAKIESFELTGSIEGQFTEADLEMPEEWLARCKESPESCSFLMFGEPFSFPALEWLRRVNEQCPQVSALGGMASGGAGPGTNRLFWQDQVLRNGGVGVFLDGVPVRHVVSQGCRPLGKAMIITKSEKNVIHELAGKPPLKQLEAIYRECDETERAMLDANLKAGSLHVGQAVDERKSQPERGDFLVRGVIGSDPSSGSMAIGDEARRGRTIRFHVRDADSADEDLRLLLTESSDQAKPGGALLFSCNGRGTRLFPDSDHDSGCIQTQFPELPLAGFFAAGEIGPVGGKNFLHGFTASIALFD